MKITRENCEAWFLDYYEGRLSKEGVEELFAFLVLNPDVRELFDSYEAISFSPDEKIEFDRKTDLHKTGEPPVGITLSNYEEYFVSAVEGLLSDDEQKQLEQFLAKYPSKRAELELLRTTILEPDTTDVFDGKDALKKSVLITETNFEEFAVAAMEGELSADVLAQFHAFLAAHPERQREFELFAKTKLQPEAEIIFENKAALKKSVAAITAENFGEMAIASVEGLLNAEEKKALDAFVSADPVRKNELAAYAQTKVQPDLSVVFEDKASLKRKEKDRGAFWWVTDIRFAAAAVVALLIGIFMWNYSAKNTGTTTGGGIALNGGHSHQQDSSANSSNGANQNSNSSLATTNGGMNQSGNVQQPHEVVTHDHSNNGQVTPQQEREPFTAIAVNTKFPKLPVNTVQEVNFSGEYFNTLDGTETPQQASSSDAITLKQYAMRWMKKQLDHSPSLNEDNEQDVHYAMNNSKNDGDVSGFDLTSSAVNRIGEATGSNLHLAKESEGTVLTIWKYRVFLNHNR